MEQDPTARHPGRSRSGAPARPAAGSPSGQGPSQLGQDPECREALDRLYHFLDGELTEERRTEIEEHLKTCMPCLEAFDFEAELKSFIARRCRDDVPRQLRVRVAQALSEASASGGAVPVPRAGAGGGGLQAPEQAAGLGRLEEGQGRGPGVPGSHEEQ